MAHRFAIYRDFMVHRDVDRPAGGFEPGALAERRTINLNGGNNTLHPVLPARSPFFPVSQTEFTTLPALPDENPATL